MIVGEVVQSQTPHNERSQVFLRAENTTNDNLFFLLRVPPSLTFPSPQMGFSRSLESFGIRRSSVGRGPTGPERQDTLPQIVRNFKTTVVLIYPCQDRSVSFIRTGRVNVFQTVSTSEYRLLVSRDLVFPLHRRVPGDTNSGFVILSFLTQLRRFFEDPLFRVFVDGFLTEFLDRIQDSSGFILESSENLYMNYFSVPRLRLFLHFSLNH